MRRGHGAAEATYELQRIDGLQLAVYEKIQMKRYFDYWN
jgi:hypothetical protein